MMVKICGITNREDALAAVEAGASAIGFNFYRESPRYISHTGAAMIAEKIPANVWKVGVFVNETPETIARIVLDAGLDVAQLHGSIAGAGHSDLAARYRPNEPQLKPLGRRNVEAVADRHASPWNCLAEPARRGTGRAPQDLDKSHHRRRPGRR